MKVADKQRTVNVLHSGVAKTRAWKLNNIFLVLKNNYLVKKRSYHSVNSTMVQAAVGLFYNCRRLGDELVAIFHSAEFAFCSF